MSPEKRRLPSTNPMRVAAVGVLTAIGLLVSACSSSGSSTPPAATTAPAGTTAPAASVPAASVVASAPVAVPSSAPASAPASSAPTTSGGGINLGSGSFCAIAKAEQKASDKEAASASSGDPASLEKLETEGLTELQKFVAIAPSAIKPDVQVIAAADQKLFAALKAAKFMIAKVDQSVLTSLQTPAFTAAEMHITTYLATTCGIKASDSN